MTIEDARVIGIGSVALLIVFLAIRHVILGGTLDIWGAIRRYVVVKIADMSSDDLVLGQFGTSSHSGSTGSRDLVPGHWHQAEPQEPDENEPSEKSFARQLAREELIITLAVQRKDNGDYLFSANQITSFVGGAAAPVKATIANVRGKREVPPASRSVQRPLNGW